MNLANFNIYSSLQRTWEMGLYTFKEPKFQMVIIDVGTIELMWQLWIIYQHGSNIYHVYGYFIFLAVHNYIKDEEKVSYVIYLSGLLVTRCYLQIEFQLGCPVSYNDVTHCSDSLLFIVSPVIWDSYCKTVFVLIVWKIKKKYFKDFFL